jgi:hypothetical protein
MVQIGTYEELLVSLPSFYHLLNNIHQQEQSERSIVMQRGRSFRGVTLSETGTEEDEQLLTAENLEMKEKGSVKWHVYIEYLRASVGLIVGLVLLISIFGIREATSVFASWWLAGWSEDEGYRHSQSSNCTETRDKKISSIHSMNDVQWNNHRNRRFYFYCGL